MPGLASRAATYAAASGSRVVGQVGPQRFRPRAAGGPAEVAGVGSGQRLETHPPALQDERVQVGRGRPGGHRVADRLAVLVGAGHGSGSSSNAGGRPSMASWTVLTQKG